MKYVDERLAAFDQDKLGFPSISACHAIVYLTSRGLYGYHNLGGETPERWRDAPKKFGEFVDAKLASGEAGLGLYGCAHVTGQRGYPGDKQTAWRTELKEFAARVGWRGDIWGYDLSGFDDQPGYDAKKSAYVECRKVGGKCLLYARQWRDHENMSGVPDGAHGAIARSGMPQRVTTALSPGGGALYNITPVKLD